VRRENATAEALFAVAEHEADRVRVVRQLHRSAAAMESSALGACADQNGRIAFNSDRVTSTNPEGDHETFVMNADGSHARPLTFNALDDEDPAWSPDGKAIAVARISIRSRRRMGPPGSVSDTASLRDTPIANAEPPRPAKPLPSG
jgi:hypothetical protein